MPANVHPPRQHAGVAALVGGEERVLAPWSLMVCVCAGGGGGKEKAERRGREIHANLRRQTRRIHERKLKLTLNSKPISIERAQTKHTFYSRQQHEHRIYFLRPSIHSPSGLCPVVQVALLRPRARAWPAYRR